MTGELPLPRFNFRPDRPSLWAMLSEGVGNPAAVIPAAILDQPAVQLPGPGAPLVVSAPELVREVLNDRADHFTRDRYIRRLFRRSWGQGLAAAEGDDWQRQRRAAVPFFTPKSVKVRQSAFAAAADAVIDGLADGETIDLSSLSARIVTRVVLGVLVDAQGLVDPDAAAADVIPYVRRLAGFTLLDLMPLPERLNDRLHRIDSDPAVQRIRAMGRMLANARHDSPSPADMIALLEGVGPVADNIRGLFPAAMDTTVAGLGWAFHVMARRPDWQERVAAEGRALGDTPDFDQLAVTRRVVSEILRLYPPAPLMARCAAQDTEIAGHNLKAGRTVLVAVYAMHRHRLVWNKPDQFDPDRWLPGTSKPDAWMPFGSGPRMCIAAHFAQAEMAVILARVLARLRIEPSGPEPIVSLQVTTRSTNGLAAIAKLRA